MDKVYKNKNWLLEHYHRRRLSGQECADLSRCSKSTIRRWIKKHGIPRRTLNEALNGRHRIYKDKDWLQEQYCERELTTLECGRLASCSSATIRAWLDKHGILRHMQVWPVNKSYKDKDWLQEHYCERELSVLECGELADCHSVTIWKWLKKHGIPRRTLSEAGVISRARGSHDSEETRQKRSDSSKAAHAARGDFDNKEIHQKISDGLKAAWRRGAYDGVYQSPTSIEIAIADALDTAEIDHVKQFRPDGCSFVYDEYLPILGILLEVNGDYWHSLPSVPEKDARKAAWAMEYGFLLVVIWESEIKEHGALAMIRSRLEQGRQCRAAARAASQREVTR